MTNRDVSKPYSTLKASEELPELKDRNIQDHIVISTRTSLSLIQKEKNVLDLLRQLSNTLLDADTVVIFAL